MYIGSKLLFIGRKRGKVSMSNDMRILFLGVGLMGGTLLINMPQIYVAGALFAGLIIVANEIEEDEFNLEDDELCI